MNTSDSRSKDARFYEQDAPEAAGESRSLVVLVIEDDAETAELVCDVIEEETPATCLPPCMSVKTARKRLAKDRPDIVLVDLNLGNQSALPLIREIRQQLRPNGAIVVFTVDHRPESVLQAMRNGACGYLFKPVGREGVRNAIIDAAAGQSPMSRQVARLLVERLNKEGVGQMLLEKLSPREEEILLLLAKGLSYADIAGELGLALGTVRTYINRMYKKLHVNSRGEAVSLFLNGSS